MFDPFVVDTKNVLILDHIPCGGLWFHTSKCKDYKHAYNELCLRKILRCFYALSFRELQYY